ncbi:hypothetical protein BDA96_08G175800 [Sorghum bicolor]|uniref:Uncharacterized protein n=2 Tax=Sorghum bicolor TaxID=4558 RepID=A0A921QG78_SORBI|nr:hypothetical protein BDA96_08G175800 [Sorghum bicolor]OQU79532.1 hypothetical protein SORBI_3008G159150 [Sorghum bicolor]
MHAWKARMHAKQKFFNCVLATQLRSYSICTSTHNMLGAGGVTSF